jgi:cytochrome c peroxidase
MCNPLSIRLLFYSLVFTLCSCSADTWESPEPFTFEIPSHFQPVPQPVNNPATAQGIFLGRKLFFDPILSLNNNLSCASCHRPEFSFAEPLMVSTGTNGGAGNRNAPSLVNIAYANALFWDGRVKSLEDQVLETVPNPLEMGLPWSQALQRLSQHTDYPDLFFRAFGPGEITAERVAFALAQFQRSLLSYNSKFDKYIRGEAMLTPAELRGLDLFRTEKADCFHCHPPEGSFLFSLNRFSNNGLQVWGAYADSGRATVTGLSSDIGRFRIPGLRNLAYTAPYMHNGSLATLEDVIAHYVMGGHPAPTIDPLMKFTGTGLSLTLQERNDLLGFLNTLNDDEFVSFHVSNAP